MEIGGLEQRLADKDAFITMITPVIGDAIRHRVRDNREEIIEALYPVIGQLVMRAVSEAMRDLARTIDAQRRAFTFEAIKQRWLDRFSGISEVDSVLREVLPFEVAEIFLIHRDSGLLLWYHSRNLTEGFELDMVSGMLTAIRDFVKESFGRGERGNLMKFNMASFVS